MSQFGFLTVMVLKPVNVAMGCAAVAAFLHKHELIGEPSIRLETSHRITECAIVNAVEQERYIVDVNLGSPCLDPKEVPFLVEEQRTQYELSVPSQDTPLRLSVLSLGNLMQWSWYPTPTKCSLMYWGQRFSCMNLFHFRLMSKCLKYKVIRKVNFEYLSVVLGKLVRAALVPLPRWSLVDSSRYFLVQ